MRLNCFHDKHYLSDQSKRRLTPQVNELGYTVPPICLSVEGFSFPAKIYMFRDIIYLVAALQTSNWLKMLETKRNNSIRANPWKLKYTLSLVVLASPKHCLLPTEKGIISFTVFRFPFLSKKRLGLKERGSSKT